MWVLGIRLKLSGLYKTLLLSQHCLPLSDHCLKLVYWKWSE